jgi:shikimate 5-dehydrogenase
MERLGRILHVREAALQPTLDAIAQAALETIAAARYAGVNLLDHGRFVPQAVVGQPPLELNLRCPASMVVADIVYAPLVTGLLATARERGLRTADGLGMLLHQAVRGFQLWFGIKPEVTPELRALVEADLLKKT